MVPPSFRLASAALPPLLVILLRGPVATAEDLSFVSDGELAGELAARRADLERTRGRLRAVEADLEAAREDLDAARLAAGVIEAHLAARVALLYRLSRHGGALRWLLGSGSGAAPLRRIATLKRLVQDSLEQRRDAGLRLAQLEERIEAAARERGTASELELRLEAAREELEAERARRGP
jgi:chromosome segregation ATPase